MDVLDALEVNTRVECLYIQNFERGMVDGVLGRLTTILRLRRIWAVNVGENFELSMPAWRRFADALPRTDVAFLYVSEHHLQGTDLKKRMRDAARVNRKKASPRDPAVCDKIKVKREEGEKQCCFFQAGTRRTPAHRPPTTCPPPFLEHVVQPRRLAREAVDRRNGSAAPAAPGPRSPPQAQELAPAAAATRAGPRPGGAAHGAVGRGAGGGGRARGEMGGAAR
jgi:hypothetical protein